jgi:hypothetical protein
LFEGKDYVGALSLVGDLLKEVISFVMLLLLDKYEKVYFNISGEETRRQAFVGGNPPHRESNLPSSMIFIFERIFLISANMYKLFDASWVMCRFETWRRVKQL